MCRKGRCLRVTKSTTASALVRISLTQGRRPMECWRRSSECEVQTMEGYSAIRSSPIPRQLDALFVTTYRDQVIRSMHSLETHCNQSKTNETFVSTLHNK
ncbi:hypothetical protein O6H91_10G084900 [Diphasiastrum complanatum]|uniref:Uncharacterized protein n=1 Tax=Diphasiastrum complanatum TaxID=34168 RepID=A0ACC2CJF6_DIPCM|nr:hypothetical protein O6H91_10G084900 [Diphasiastrum complanatum]